MDWAERERQDVANVHSNPNYHPVTWAGIIARGTNSSLPSFQDIRDIRERRKAKRAKLQAELNQSRELKFQKREEAELVRKQAKQQKELAALAAESQRLEERRARIIGSTISPATSPNLKSTPVLTDDEKHDKFLAQFSAVMAIVECVFAARHGVHLIWYVWIGVFLIATMVQVSLLKRRSTKALTALGCIAFLIYLIVPSSKLPAASGAHDPRSSSIAAPVDSGTALQNDGGK